MRYPFNGGFSIFVCFRFLPKKRIPRESCFFPLPEWVGQVIHVFILLSSHPIVGGLGWWGNAGKSPRLTNCWIGWSQLMETPQPKTPIGGCSNCFLKGTKTRNPPVWNPPPPIDANEFVLFLPMKVSFFVSLWGYDLEVMTLCIYIIDFAFSHPPSTIYVRFLKDFFAAVAEPRWCEPATETCWKKKSPWTSQAPPCDGCGKNSTKYASNFRNSNASKGV